MTHLPVPTLASLSSAFASACRMARTDSELFERCREVLIQRFESDQIWLTVSRNGSGSERVGGPEGFRDAIEVARSGSGETELVILATPEIATTMGPMAMSLAVGLSI